MSKAEDEKFMRRCLDLAVKAEGFTYPNPLVGSVIVHDDRITGEGFHMKAGSPHAEVLAIRSAGIMEKLKNSTLYVNLEPCSHFGKTPPCVDLIISAGIPRIVVGTTDTSEKVSGAGLLKLREAGCEVITGVLEEDCRRINRRFFTFHEKRRPYITLKWAQSADGFIDRVRLPEMDNRPEWITGMPERVLVHRWRASEEAILVGANTFRLDSPQLNVRDWTGKDPVRLILSRSGLIESSSLLNDKAGPALIFTHNRDTDLPGAGVVLLNDEKSAAEQVSEYLYGMGIQSLFIEGGTRVIEHFVSLNMWDEARIFTGRDQFRGGVRAPGIKGKVIFETIFFESHLKVILKDSNTE